MDTASFYAYRMLAGYLARFYPRLKPRTMEDYTLVTGEIQGGDLASMLGLKDMFSETVYLLNPKFVSRAKRVPVLYPVKSSRFSRGI